MGKSNKVEETAYEKELAKVYSEQWEVYQKDIVPIENQVIDEAKASNDDTVYQDIADNTNLGYQKAFGGAGENTLKAMTSHGIDPSSGKAKGLLSDLNDEQASVSADAKARGQLDGQERHIDKMSNVMAMGQGEAKEAVSSLNDIAANSQKKAFSDASISAKNKNNLLSTVGAVGGAVTSHSLSKPASTAAKNSANFVDSNGDWMGP